INEGSVATLTGDISEPDSTDSFFLNVAWGDGKKDSYVFAPGTEHVNVTHRYDDGSAAGKQYTIQLSWHDNAGEGNGGDLTTKVFNVAPTVDAGGLVVLKEDQTLKRVASFSDPSKVDTFTATVDYGDGSGPQSAKVEKDNELKLHHHYKEPGVYKVTVTVVDNDGGVGTDSFFVVVLPKSGPGNKWLASLGSGFADLVEQLKQMGF